MPKVRATINVLILSDPACGKSTISQYLCSQFKGKNNYVSCTTSSLPGIVGGLLNKRKLNDFSKYRTFVLTPGAIQKSQNGICILDEIDKSPKSFFGALKVIELFDRTMSETLYFY